MGEQRELKDRVLEVLENSDQAVSGEEMAQRLGVSRNSVWKAVKKLREAGYEIDAVTNRGYQLLSESDVLTVENIRRGLGEDLKSLALDVRETVTSTNTVLKAIAEAGGREGMVVIAQSQSAGKGRLGRSFHSPKGTGLYLSVLLRPKFPAEQSLLITTAAAVAVARGIEEATGKPAEIKWVNDVYCREKKVCGILTEAAIDFENGGLHYAVLGLGVNLQDPPGGFGGDLAQVAGAVYERECPKGMRSKLAAAILNAFFSYYVHLTEKGFMEEYRKRSFLDGMAITFSLGQETYQGVVLGVDEEARLQVRLSDGSVRGFSAGEVQIQKGFEPSNPDGGLM